MAPPPSFRTSSMSFLHACTPSLANLAPVVSSTVVPGSTPEDAKNLEYNRATVVLPLKVNNAKSNAATKIHVIPVPGLPRRAAPNRSSLTFTPWRMLVSIFVLIVRTCCLTDSSPIISIKASRCSLSAFSNLFWYSQSGLA